MTNSNLRILTLGAALLALGLLLPACTGTQQTHNFRYSGFLRNYEQLQPGTSEDDPILGYSNPDANWASYDKVMIDRVTIWRTMGSNLPTVPQTELQHLADHLYWAVRKQLEQDYEIVDFPGKSVMRLRVALTEARSANTAMTAVSRVSPVPLVSGVTKLTTGTYAFVGEAGIEGEILDSLTQVRLSAAVDSRAGDRRGGATEWSDVENAFDFWAERLRVRLAARRGQGG